MQRIKTLEDHSVHFGADFSNTSYQVLFYEKMVTGAQYEAIKTIDSKEEDIQKKGESFLLAIEPEKLLKMCPDAKTFVAYSLFQDYARKHPEKYLVTSKKTQ
eukprot:TRINITY_DN6771_c0_g1_i1.p1 TRINITY_DN6771_c0_g1~~TRINITY_DN6771_c0_g1_i1.p1  ORF type:complete len:102 (+),score=26.61 TRINITY_DN6771_c0_g1_i1:44-349(+)